MKVVALGDSGTPLSTPVAAGTWLLLLGVVGLVFLGTVGGRRGAR